MTPLATSARRGAVLKGLLLVGGLVVAALVVLVLVGTGRYNALVLQEEAVRARWSQVENQYQRRADLVPQLVSTVQGAADFERSTLTEVTEARRQVQEVRLPEDLPRDAEALAEYMAAQSTLSGALGRLLAVAEAYPTLKASDAFRDLQVQLEGTENRIAVARADYIETVQGYNASLRRFPNNLFASFFGFEPAAQPEVDQADMERPDVEFDFGR